MRRFSLHIGLNAVDPRHYVGEDGTPWSGHLQGCEADAKAMQVVSARTGAQTTLLLTAEATSAAVTASVLRFADLALDGDIVVITYSGHGGSIPDHDGDEPDGFDESWLLYDRMLLDDEIRTLLARFARGARVIVVADSCHSGTVVKAFYDQIRVRDDMPEYPVTAVSKAAPEAVVHWTLLAHADKYRAVHRTEVPEPSASLLLLAACGDLETAGDGVPNGVFTTALLKALDEGRFQGTFQELIRRISQMVTRQTPQVFRSGPVDAELEASVALALGASEPTGSSPVAPAPDPGEVGAPAGAPSIPFTDGIVAMAVVLGLAAIGFLIVINAGVPVPQLADDAEPAQVASRIGAFIVRWGLVLAVVAFVPGLVIAALAAFVYPAKARTAVGARDWSQTLTSVVEKLPDLIRQPAGIGMALVVLGIILMLGSETINAVGEDGATAAPSSAVVTESAAPSADAPVETSSPSPSQ